MALPDLSTCLPDSSIFLPDSTKVRSFFCDLCLPLNADLFHDPDLE